MPRRTRPSTKIRISIDLTGLDLERCRELAERQSMTLTQVVRESIELAIARGSTR